MQLFRTGFLLAGLFMLPVVQPEATAAPVAPAAARPKPSPNVEANLVLLEVRLGSQLLSDGVTAYQIGRRVFLPLGETARLLTLAVRVTDQGRASGYILTEDRNFSLDVPAGTVHAGGKDEPLERAQVMVEAEDIFVDSALLARWLPVDLDIDMHSLTLKVRPREPLPARTALFGSVAVPGVDNISASSATGNGIALSNRPLTQPTSFDRHTLQGDLPPGWDVELYYNDALVGFQQSRPDGKYSFPDQPLAYGPNEFRLVFHGPLGQLRVERQSFLLEESTVPRGALFYDVAAHRDQFGHPRAVAQFEWGLSDHLNATGGWQRAPVLGGGEQNYANLGLRSYWNAFILSGDAIRAEDGGRLAQLELKTRVGNLALSASRARLEGFTSEFYPQTSDPVRTRDALRAEGALAPGGM